MEMVQKYKRMAYSIKRIKINCNKQAIFIVRTQVITYDNVMIRLIDCDNYV